MGLKLLVKLGEKILGKSYENNEPRADMYMDVRILAIAVGCLGACVLMAVRAATQQHIAWALLAVALLLLGVGALLCWRNQTIQMLSDDEFEYSTFLGNKKLYRFDDIVALRRNKDSMTLMLKNGKVHIESNAVLTQRLADRINRALQPADEQSAQL